MRENCIFVQGINVMFLIVHDFACFTMNPTKNIYELNYDIERAIKRTSAVTIICMNPLLKYSFLMNSFIIFQHNTFFLRFNFHSFGMFSPIL